MYTTKEKEMTTLTELKTKAKELGLSDDYIKTFGNRSKKATYEAAIAKKEFNQQVKPKQSNQEFVEQIEKLTTKEDIKQAVLNYMPKVKERSTSHATFKTNVKRLIDDIREVVKEYPESLASPYKSHTNYCGISYIYEYAYPEEKTEQKNEPIKIERVFHEVVVYDFQKVIDESIKNLTSDKWQVLASSVAFLTGRRPSEVCCISKFEAVADNKITVSNIAKKRDGKRTLLQIPTLANADDIQAAVEKIRQLKPMPDVIEVYKNQGMSAARERFNSYYAAGDYGLNSIFNKELAHIVDSSDKKSFGATRNFYASAIYWICINHFNTTPKDANKFTQDCMGHDSGETTLVYNNLKFINLPEVKSDFFENIGAIQMSDVTMNLNITEFSEHLTESELITFKQCVEKFPDSFEKAIIQWKRITKPQDGIESKVVRKIEYKERPKAKDRINVVIQAMINHNEKLLLDRSIIEPEKLYVTITKGSIDTMCKAILGSKQAPETLRTVYEANLDKINECNQKWNVAGSMKEIDYKANNLHIRPVRKGDGVDSIKMDIVITSVSVEYNAMQMQDL